MMKLPRYSRNLAYGVAVGLVTWCAGLAWGLGAQLAFGILMLGLVVAYHYGWSKGFKSCSKIDDKHFNTRLRAYDTEFTAAVQKMMQNRH